MDLLVYLFALLRPVFLMELPIEVGGLSVLQLAAVAFIFILGAGLVWHLGLSRQVVVTPLDVAMILFVCWCIAGWVAYPQKVSFSHLLKMVLPFVQYLILKNILENREQFLTALRLMLIGFSVPVLGSAGLILLGFGLEKIHYWTGIARYEGVFANPHTFGHVMGFYLMVVVLYWTLKQAGSKVSGLRASSGTDRLLLFLVFPALFCLYMSYVRTVFIGLIIFFGIYLFFVNKRLLILLTMTGAVGVVVFAPVVALIFTDVVEVMEGKRELERIGSGRPYYWKHNLSVFFNALTFDRLLIGGGIGNIVPMGTFTGKESFWNSHSDYLDIFIQTGFVGAILFFAIQFGLFSRIVRLQGHERIVYMALFISVSVMNAVSNSYVTRFGPAQLLMLVLVYVEVAAKEREKLRESSRARNYASSSPG